VAALSAHLDLPYTPQQMFDLVADIERYPSFIPHIASARITQRSGNTLLVDQAFRFRMLRLNFSTRAVLEPPSRLTVVSRDPALGSFTQTWGFAERPEGGTNLTCRTEFGTRSRLLQLLLGKLSDELMNETMRSFQQRARQMYGTAAVPAGAPPATSPRQTGSLDPEITIHHKGDPNVERS
jgi:coenzyme Q-binding protein COQ10